MTEIDTAKVREMYRDGGAMAADAVLEFCDALDAARAERDRLACDQDCAAMVEEWAARTEAAEARVTELAIEAADREFLRAEAEARIAAALAMLQWPHLIREDLIRALTEETP